MFEEILGIPAHPLLLHAAVVFIPLQVLAALAYILVPSVRRHIWWAVAALIVVAPGAALLTKLSGDALRARLVNRKEVSPQGLSNIDTHRSYGTITVYLTAGLSVLLIILLLAQRAVASATAPAGMVIPVGGSGALGAVLSALILAASVVTGYYIFKTGDTGAHSVWGSL